MIKEKLILIGGGGHCKSSIDVIEAEGRFLIAGILDIKEKIGTKILDYEIIGTDDDIEELSKDNLNFFITVGQIKSALIRMRIFEKLKAKDISLPIIISPEAYVSKYAQIGEGSIIMHQAFVNAGAVIGSNTIVNTAALIEHDAKVGNHCHISTGAIINGDCKVEDGCFIASNSVLAHGVRIHENSIIAAGTPAFKDLESNKILMGLPGKIIKKI
jgi:sugar O-acyltransferase (sialic acid O-acetyltransferase NeuD family)